MKFEHKEAGEFESSSDYPEEHLNMSKQPKFSIDSSCGEGMMHSQTDNVSDRCQDCNSQEEKREDCEQCHRNQTVKDVRYGVQGNKNSMEKLVNNNLTLGLLNIGKHRISQADDTEAIMSSGSSVTSRSSPHTVLECDDSYAAGYTNCSPIQMGTDELCSEDKKQSNCHNIQPLCAPITKVCDHNYNHTGKTLDRSSLSNDTADIESSNGTACEADSQASPEPQGDYTQSISPNFKVRMSSKVTEFLSGKPQMFTIGSIGSLPGVPVQLEMSEPLLKKDKSVKKSLVTKAEYPNIRMPAVAKNYSGPLKDHDYCFEVFSHHIEEAKQQMRFNKLKPKNIDRPKRKYRTKKIIQMEKEAAERAACQNSPQSPQVEENEVDKAVANLLSDKQNTAMTTKTNSSVNGEQDITEVLTVLGIPNGNKGSDQNLSQCCPSSLELPLESLRVEMTSDAASPSSLISPVSSESHLPAQQGFIDKLLESMTEEQISEVVQALEVQLSPVQANPPTPIDSGKIDPNSMDQYAVPSDVAVIPSTSCTNDLTNSPLPLAKLAMLAWETSSIANQPPKQTFDAQDLKEDTMNTSAEQPGLFDLDPELLDNLTILGDLSSSPPKALRPSDLSDIPDADELIDPERAATKLDSTNRTWNEESFYTPKVITICMFWNTFPGLMVNGEKVIRLVDIHRQALRSKDTGLLKKRAQSLGFSVTNCTDLQRNLLIRVAYASPSRSNLIVSEGAAEAIIRSYMEPHEIDKMMSTTPSDCDSRTGSLGSLTNATMSRPGDKKANSPDELPVKRASRLRQVKSTYRRFLKLADDEERTGAQSENSDKGYHSDHTISSQHGVSKRRKAKNPTTTKKQKKARKQILGEECEQLCSASSALTEKALQSDGDDSNLSSVTSVPEENACPSPERVHLECQLETQSEGDDPVLVRHADFAVKKNGIPSSQDGNLHLSLFKSLHAPCIRCCTCQKFFAVKAFTKHQHHNGKVVKVKVRQRLEARSSSVDSNGWLAFKKQKELLQKARSPLKRLIPAEPIRCLPPQTSSTMPGTALGKRIRKQKQYSPDELYYTSSEYRKRKSTVRDGFMTSSDAHPRKRPRHWSSTDINTRSSHPVT